MPKEIKIGDTKNKMEKEKLLRFHTLSFYLVPLPTSFMNFKSMEKTA